MSWNRKLLLTKIKALGAHLGISVVLVGIAVWLILFRWFPTPLFTTDGGGVGLKLLLLVDLVLGPLLTFVVFNPLKARRLMVLDLAVIAMLQLSAYGAGLWSIYTVRVQAVALHEGVFHAVTAKEYQDQTIEPDSWQALGPRAPHLVNVRAPLDGDEAMGVTAFGFTAGLEPYQLQFLYQPLAAAWPAARQQGWPLTELQASQPAIAARAAAWLGRHADLKPETIRFYRVEGFYGSAVLALDETGASVGGFDGDLAKRP
ncbi:MAG: hypothetical protein Q7J29_03900 [Stagnimonas sp.]|nr:hypothetical protein [Stagnimonas sp.]